MTKILHDRIRWLLAMAAILLTSGGISAATETATRLYDSTLLTKTVRTVDGVQYTHLSWLGLDATSMPGAPEMPVEYIRFIVPVYTNNFRVTVTAGGLSRQTLEAPVFPSQEPVPTSYEGPVEFTVPDPQYYSATQPIRAEYVEDGFVDGCNHIVTVAVYPASYDDASLSVTTASTVNVTLEYDSCTAAELESTPIFPPRASKYLDLKSMVVNGERTMNRQYAPREKASPDAPEYYYIITPRNLEEAFQDLAIWKRQKGYNVIVKCIEDVYADPRYRIGAMYSLKDETPQQVVDSAMSLRCYLRDQFELNGGYFCLLAGDWHTPMPIRRVVETKRADAIPNSHDFSPTDNYFSDFTTGFELTNNYGGIYSLSKHTPYSPDIYLGRLLSYKPEHVKNYMNKLLIYEANPGLGENDYLDNAFYMYEKDGLGQVGKVESVFNPFKNTLVILDSCQTSRIGPPHTGSDVINYMRGKGFINLHCHGGPTAMLTCGLYPYSFIISQSSYRYNHELGPWVYEYSDDVSRGIDCMNNTNFPGVLYTISCITAPFDDYCSSDHHFDADYNMAQAYTIAGNYGGVAYLGNTRDGSWTNSTELEKKWGEQMLLKQKVGISEALSKNIYMDSVGSWFKTRHNLVGEPEFEMWLGKPNVLDVNITPTISGLNIQGNLPDSTYYVLSNGNSYSTKKIISGSQFANPYPAEYCFALWKTGYLPIINLYAQKGSFAETKRYIVRNAFLGAFTANGVASGSYSVLENGNLYIRATDGISINNGFTIENGGVVELNCEQTVNLKGGEVKRGGKLIIHAKDVKMGAGFKVAPGGILQIFN